jgi:hypothetical protein
MTRNSWNNNFINWKQICCFLKREKRNPIFNSKKELKISELGRSKTHHKSMPLHLLQQRAGPCSKERRDKTLKQKPNVRKKILSSNHKRNAVRSSTKTQPLREKKQDNDQTRAKQIMSENPKIEGEQADSYIRACNYV